MISPKRFLRGVVRTAGPALRRAAGGFAVLRCGLAALMILLASQAVGCSTKRFYKKPWMTTKGDVARYLDEALQHENADVRRDNIVHVSKTRYAGHDTVIEACCFIARNDRSASVRVAAIRLVAESLRRDAAVALLDMLDNRDQAVSAEARVHEEIVNGLYFMQRNGSIPDPLGARVVQTAARLLRGGPSRDVRICAARLLGA